MTIARTLLALFFAVLVTVTCSFAGEAHEKKMIKLELNGDSEPTELDITELEVGESRQYFDEEGRKVLVTRLEEGLEIDVDGETIEVRSPGHIGIHEEHEIHEGHEGQRRVIIKKLGGGDGEDVDVNVEVLEGGSGEHSRLVVKSIGSAADRLIESGALDELDEETRQRILDALGVGDADGGEGAAEVVIIEKKVKKKAHN